MGVVYRAEDSALGRTVAIKTIALTGAAHERDVHEARFLQEARAAGGIGHPAIITIYDVGREGDIAFIAMELLEGNELRDLIRWGTLTPSQAVGIAATVAEGLAYAHERGVVHRDIKPGNIMLLKDGRVKLMDFGIARLVENAVKTQTGTLLGSPQYMSPEQIAGRRAGPSLGHLLARRGALRDAHRRQALRRRGRDRSSSSRSPTCRPSRRATSRPTLPPVIDYIVARALKKMPDERYQSAAELAKDLRESLEEVKACEAAARGQADAGVVTVPNTPAAPQLAAAQGAPQPSRPLALSDEQVELRPSPRFDSVEALARLAVLPADATETQSRAGWTVPHRQSQEASRSHCGRKSSPPMRSRPSWP